VLSLTGFFAIPIPGFFIIQYLAIDFMTIRLVVASVKFEGHHRAGDP
jgi:hypothetical protein